MSLPKVNLTSDEGLLAVAMDVEITMLRPSSVVSNWSSAGENHIALLRCRLSRANMRGRFRVRNVTHRASSATLFLFYCEKLFTSGSKWVCYVVVFVSG